MKSQNLGCAKAESNRIDLLRPAPLPRLLHPHKCLKSVRERESERGHRETTGCVPLNLDKYTKLVGLPRLLPPHKPTRWSTTLSPQVNLPHAIDLSA